MATDPWPRSPRLWLPAFLLSICAALSNASCARRGLSVSRGAEPALLFREPWASIGLFRWGSLNDHHGIGSADFPNAVEQFLIGEDWITRVKRSGRTVRASRNRRKPGIARASSVNKLCKRSTEPRSKRSTKPVRAASLRDLDVSASSERASETTSRVPTSSIATRPFTSRGVLVFKMPSSFWNASGNTNASITPVRSCRVRIVQRAPRLERIGRICTMIPPTTMSSLFFLLSIEASSVALSSFIRPANLSSGWPEM